MNGGGWSTTITITSRSLFSPGDSGNVTAMSTAKRSRQRQADALPSKRLKSSHVPAKSGLGFLVDDEARAGKKLDAKLTNGVPRAKTNRVDDSRAVAAQLEPDSESDDEDTIRVAHKKEQLEEVIEITSGEESSELAEEDEDDAAMDDEADDLDLPLQLERRPLTNGHVAGSDEDQATAGAGDMEMEDAEAVDEPTFGEQLQTRHPNPIDIQQTEQAPAGGNAALVPAGERGSLQPPTAGSLGTVLAQALKTNDKDLLESCFGMPDVNAIRATIQRLQPQQIAVLLERVAERIHRRPGRAGKLMVWVQWSLVTHGGYLANQPKLMRKMKSLAQVTRERANGLQPLLHLKGKLDLLSAQLEARRNMQAASRAANEEDDEEGVLYIEGEDKGWPSDEDAADEQRSSSKRQKPRSKPLSNATADDSDDASAGDDDLPNGFINGIEDDSSADGDDDGERNALIDAEASETSNDEGSSNDDAESVASSLDDDESSDGEESEVEVKHARPQTLNRKR